ncbi:ABC transporter ATP-binding protein [Verminephrobacter eiseniae]|uniref:ABC transporter related n=1 Tax=Verminephrobacter eiseniae (strain EF01-2) TaxID=391735 RepID=A1WQK5_VEREI|nr:ABC transporter ATP-binding protein [Verminephrobacter eiseniae]ABM59912.1 ABC transporter related [Verminephrobacter eiseniae EF01-2]MCW5258916.1 ABC transporter ATP-binding protein [Verminephrobacter eiseniae]MCW5285420.1 ABC transporter ATP-binding protein [Verminephrobacter eiseniae]MCW5303720.1 ABC transporter ATP-binding protein [Verminephrobacter eiseniae]MCW8181903.1 ABC transporter ATP-binding protein [Verminephrobacter eiseniae]
MLKVQGLTGGYGDSQVLFGIDFEAQAGQAVSLIGRNGMGKTTTVRTLMGMLPARGGSIELQGKVLGRLASHVVARLGVGLVPEGRRVFGSLSVEENLVATARAAEGRSGWSLDRVLDLFPRLRERRRQSARTLSGGEQQMLAIGRALMTNPQLLVLDEATEGLAPLIRHEIWDCLRTLKREGMTIVVVDKNLTEMASLLDRHHIVEKGRVVWSGTPEELKSRADLAHRYLGI